MALVGVGDRLRTHDEDVDDGVGEGGAVEKHPAVLAQQHAAHRFEAHHCIDLVSRPGREVAVEGQGDGDDVRAVHACDVERGLQHQRADRAVFHADALAAQRMQARDVRLGDEGVGAR